MLDFLFVSVVLHSCLTVRIDKGETLRGPIYSFIPPKYEQTFELRDGMELHGPMVIQLCDGHLVITKP